MKDERLHEALALLHEARRESARNANDRTDELVGLAMKRLEESLADERLSNRERLELLNKILLAVPPAAKLIDTLLQKL